ncbi:DUF3861 domain-containing protein [uncultured Pseudodesulfovibrio sp.]|uniref:DUF3861 domain-containing protein n=1 Tax=uncultured Pseudodesulfovibrio sp. TaxID=2035858 RepID=UPI0029C980AF|nr:DUF3861 domain-containing protein [uncultured Pseudodesulfovibrio sp.]
MAEHRYKITVEPLSGEASQPLSFETSCHDDLLAVMGKIETRFELPRDEARSLGLGLKLFGEALLARREAPPFDELAPHFGQFMRTLKKRPT